MQTIAAGTQRIEKTKFMMPNDTALLLLQSPRPTTGEHLDVWLPCWLRKHKAWSRGHSLELDYEELMKEEKEMLDKQFLQTICMAKKKKSPQKAMGLRDQDHARRIWKPSCFTSTEDHSPTDSWQETAQRSWWKISQTRERKRMIHHN
jgi:hypothetical protein